MSLEPMIASTQIKNHTSDRVLILKVKDGKKPVSSIGLVDPRLFSGDNKLHAYRDNTSMLWKLRYEKGGLPEPLKENFTKFQYLIDHVKKYFDKRNVEITEVQDIYNATAA